MKTYIDVQRNYKDKVLDKVKCDLCGATATSESNWGGEDHGVSEVTIQMKEGYNYPDAGNYVETEVDICPSCFKNTLLPWLKSMGVKPQTKEVDY